MESKLRYQVELIFFSPEGRYIETHRVVSWTSSLNEIYEEADSWIKVLSPNLQVDSSIFVNVPTHPKNLPRLYICK